VTAHNPDLIIRIAARGDGVTGDGRHVPLSAPGDRLDSAGQLVPGPHHVTPPCRHFPQCGGCQIQQIDEQSLAEFVTQRVVGTLAGQGVHADVVHAAHLSPPHSRRRASLRAVRAGKSVQFGFSEEASHKIVDLSECHILRPELFALVSPLRALLKSLIADRKGAQAHMTLIDRGVDLVLEGVAVDGLAAAEGLSEFAQQHGLARLSIDEGHGVETRWEPEGATITLGGVPVPFPAHAFLQATQDGEQALIDAARAATADHGVIADLFAGLGTFALGLGEGKKVYAAEAGKAAILSLKGAAARHGRFVGADHRDLFRRPLTPEELNRFGTVVLDPPRAGAREQVAQLAQAKVPAVAYVSCNPSSFARDAKTLVEGGYRLESVTPVGQFRWSTHVELAGIFRR